jgi:ketosteroid isomerase-like protein
MNKSLWWFELTSICFFLALSFASAAGQDTTSINFDIEKEGKIIDSLDKEFARHFRNGDSAAIYSMYARDAKFEDLKGVEILEAWGKHIRNSIAMDSRNLVFTMTCLSTDLEYLVELGIYEFQDGNGATKYKGKYCVVWKQENGIWKMFRNMGL